MKHLSTEDKRVKVDFFLNEGNIFEFFNVYFVGFMYFYNSLMSQFPNHKEILKRSDISEICPPVVLDPPIIGIKMEFPATLVLFLVPLYF